MNLYLLFSGLLLIASGAALCHLFFKAGVAHGGSASAAHVEQLEWELRAVKRRLADAQRRETANV